MIGKSSLKRKIVYAAVAIVAVCTAVMAIWLNLALSNLPDVSVLKRYRPPAACEVLDRDNHVLTQYTDGAFRIWAPLADLPKVVSQAVVIAEDDTFFSHHGVNYKSVKDALILDIKKRRFVRGGSTITQQMIKNVLLSKEKTLLRKIREYVLATRAEAILSKSRILEIYLNEVEWGDHLYGIEAASRWYFDKHASELSPAEAAVLAGMLPNPKWYDPFGKIERSVHRREQVLFNMHQAKILSDAEYDAALAEPIVLRKKESGRFAINTAVSGKERPCWQRVLENRLVDFYGDARVHRDGGVIETTLDKAMQSTFAEREAGQTGITNDGDKVLVIKQGAVIRALSCDTGVGADFLAVQFPMQEYSSSVVSASDISREQIIREPAQTVLSN
jgi:penicillin-binding protein 1A